MGRTVWNVGFTVLPPSTQSGALLVTDKVTPTAQLHLVGVKSPLVVPRPRSASGEAAIWEANTSLCDSKREHDFINLNTFASTEIDTR